ncbi:MAG: hypothetical protein ACOC0P_07950, partial [Planctomycetota bacterium]
MKNRRVAGMTRGLLTLLVAMAVGAFIVPQTAVTAAMVQNSNASADAKNDKMDRIVLEDGREFVGDITAETDDTITITVEIAGIRGTQTFAKSQVLQIERNKVTRSGAESGNRAGGGNADADAELRTEEIEGRIVYVLPIKGLWGFDVYRSVVRNLWDEAIEAGAETIVLEFDTEQGVAELEPYRNFFEELKREAEAKEIEVVVWLHRAHHVTVAFALMWEDIYFHPDGSMGRGQALDQMLKDMWGDEAVLQKMIAAWVGILRGMAVEG